MNYYYAAAGAYAVYMVTAYGTAKLMKNIPHIRPG